MPKRQTDKTLIHACIKGKQEAWFDLIDRYSNLVLSVPIRYGLNLPDSEDVMQAVFVRLFRSLDSIREVNALPAWLLTTSHRETWRLAQSRKKTITLHEANASTADPPEEDLLLWEQQHLVRESLKQLGGRCQMLLELLFLSNKNISYNEIAEKLDMSIGAIGPARARCFQKLIPILETLGVSDELL